MNFAIIFGLFHLSIVWTVAGKGRIFNGHEAGPSQFPHMVGIYITKEVRSMFCGGSLISNDWVLTAAHCVDNAILVDVYLGGTNIKEFSIGYNIPNSAIHMNPGYNNMDMTNDIALIKIPFTKFCNLIAPISIPPQWNPEETIYFGEYGIISGWGWTMDRSQLSLHLRWGKIKLVENDFCNKWSPLHPIHHICGDARYYVSICYGDSGGPLILESSGELIGVSSCGLGPSCELGVPVIFTRVSPFINWIKFITGLP